MRKAIWLFAITGVLAIAPTLSAKQQSQSAQSQQSSSQQSGAQSSAQGAKTATPQKPSLADQARKVRQEGKNAPKASMVFTNDNIPTQGRGISVVGNAPAASAQGQSSGAIAVQAGNSANKNNDEANWRQKFADARHKIEQDQADLSVMQRELGQLQLQYYPDPTKALQQSVSRSDIDKKQTAITEKQKQLEADKQALSNLEDDLRKAGGDPGWARP